MTTIKKIILVDDNNCQYEIDNVANVGFSISFDAPMIKMNLSGDLAAEWKEIEK